MAAVPAHPWLPPLNPSAGGGVGPAHLITVASALRLGHHLRLRCCRHLHRLLLPPLEDCYSDNQHRIKDVWGQGSHSQRSCSLPAAFAEGVSACLSFFSGKDFGHGSPHKGNDRFDPLRGDFSSKRMWTNVLLAVNVLVYIAQIATHGRLIFWGAKVNSLIDKGQLWRLATSSFLHANIGHLLMNSYSLNSIGPTVEQLSGPRRFLAVYFTSAIASSLMSYRFCQSPAVGASGAIFGLVGSFAVFVLRHRSIFGGGKQDLQQIARVIALNMVIGILSTGIDNWGHLGGLLGGAAISWFLGPAWRYQFKDNVGRAVFVDRAPIFSFTFVNMRSLK